MTESGSTFQSIPLKADVDYLALGGSEIRLLPTVRGGGLCHCTLPVDHTPSPVAHHHVEEILYLVEGQGEVWRKDAGAESSVRVSAGASLPIPHGLVPSSGSTVPSSCSTDATAREAFRRMGKLYILRTQSNGRAEIVRRDWRNTP